MLSSDELSPPPTTLSPDFIQAYISLPGVKRKCEIFRKRLHWKLCLGHGSPFQLLEEQKKNQRKLEKKIGRFKPSSSIATRKKKSVLSF